MDAPPPPPPPPHGASPGTKSGLPPGNYDIFIIPPHSAGSGFLYLPSLQPQRNSFLAGVACTLLAVSIWRIVAPVLKEWFATVVASGGVGVVMLLIGVGVAGWAWGKTQTETGGPGSGGGADGIPKEPPNPSAHDPNTRNSGANGHAPGASMPGAAGGNYTGGAAGARPKPTWQRSNAPPTGAGTAGGGTARGGWEKAREETRKKEEERKRAEELRKRTEELRQKKEEEEKKAKEAAEKERWEKARIREREAREREAREREARQKKEHEEKEKTEREEKEKREREEKEKEKEKKEREEREERERARAKARASSAYASGSPTKSAAPRPPSPVKRHQQPTAKSYLGTEEDEYSYRPYDKPKRPVNKQPSRSSVYSESSYTQSSYAPSQSTARTTPPPSHRGAYTTKDPDKVVIKAVYSFTDSFPKLPVAQLVSGEGSVTDGLILRITTEGLFIDDDVRGVPQREWDIKAWTMKLVEVWCPNFHFASRSSTTQRPRTTNPARRLFGDGKAGGSNELSSEEIDTLMVDLLRSCQSECAGGSSNGSNNGFASSQSGEFRGLHVLRASIRDAEGKKYVFVLDETEGWKVAVGLQRLRRGTQVRAMGVSGLGPNETRVVLDNLRWT
ncbi:MAG: hypothetical protein M1835_007352 [Candelina submexicana]|nr:MAG: hypothetical protein M1835_007352 [Candelina submexicana]